MTASRTTGTVLMDSKSEDKTQEKRISSIIFSGSQASSYPFAIPYYSTPIPVSPAKVYTGIKRSGKFEALPGFRKKISTLGAKAHRLYFLAENLPSLSPTFFSRRNSDRLRTTGGTPTQKKVSFTVGKDTTTVRVDKREYSINHK